MDAAWKLLHMHLPVRLAVQACSSINSWARLGKLKHVMTVHRCTLSL